MNKIKIPVYVTLLSSVLFSIFQISFHADISLLAFPLSAAISFFTVWFVYFKLFRNEEEKSLLPSQKFLQYLPYVLLGSFILRRAGKSGTYYWYDVITVLLWATILVARYFILHYLNEKNISVLKPEWKKEKKGGLIAVKKDAGKFFLHEAIDWVDALVQSVFMVLLFQIFVLQLYVIPSESMVPSFLIGDRVVVMKTPSGPKMPLSDVGFPCLKQYKRGEVVVFRNPHYRMDRKSEIRTVVSQIIYMLTFSGVNLNVDERGEPKADPLVKRVCGLPGEQLVMQDGILYARTKKSDNFYPVDADLKFAKDNLNDLPQSLKNGIQVIPLKQNQYDLMLEVEAMRNEFDVERCALECESLTQKFGEYYSYYKTKDFENGGELPRSVYKLFSTCTEQTEKMLFSKDGKKVFDSFMTDWISNKKIALASLENDPYGLANYKLNLMLKLTAGRLIFRNAELFALKKTPAQIAEDSRLTELYETAEKLHFYTMILDQRNMPVFPANDQDGNAVYIPSGNYFMMGDNRFNSLDMRHSYEYEEKALSDWDKYSFTYESNMAPQYVSRKYILGTALYRFWPLSRRGTIKTK